MRNNLRHVRQSLNITGKGLAQMVNVSHSMIYMIESGTKNPSIQLAFRISEVLGKSIEDIFLPNIVTDSDNNSRESVSAK
jgi:putative transcriptional regulator